MAEIKLVKIMPSKNSNENESTKRIHSNRDESELYYSQIQEMGAYETGAIIVEKLTHG